MPFTTAFQALDAVAAHLPFQLYEVERVNQAFVRWRRSRHPEAKQVVDLWTYCFIRRYFLVKFAQERREAPSDLESVVEQAYRRVEENRHEIKEASRYASWVSVICKNVYLNYVRSPWQHVHFKEGHDRRFTVEPAPIYYDYERLLQVLNRAIDRLPSYLQKVARLRFVEGYTYREMGEEIDKPLPILRSYVHKVRCRFEENPALKGYVDKPVAMS